MFFWGKPDTHGIILDVTSASVGASVVRFSRTRPPHVLHSLRLPLAVTEKVSASSHFAAVQKQLDVLLARLHHLDYWHRRILSGRRPKIDQIHVMVSSPWYVSQTKTINVTKSRRFNLSLSFLKDLQKSEEKAILAENASSILKNGHFIENNVIQVRIRGYKIENYLNKSTTEAQVSLYTSAISNLFMKEIGSVVEKYFTVGTTSFHTAPLALFSVIRDTYPQNDDFIYLDVSAEQTELHIVKDDLLIETISIPIGKNFFLRRLATDLKLSLPLAESTLNLFLLKNTSTEMTAKVTESFDRSLAEWKESFSVVVDKIVKEVFIPRTLFINADDHFTGRVAETLDHTSADTTGFIDVKYEIIRYSRSRLDKQYEAVPTGRPDLRLGFQIVFLDRINKQ